MITKIPKQLFEKEINFVLLKTKDKVPFQKDWQNKTMSYNHPELINHIQKGGNYGVRGGGDKHLIIVDFDSKELQDDLNGLLPETLTVKTGSGLLHKYFFSDASDSFKIFDKDMSTLADIQGEGKQVVGAGSIHPNGNKYEIVENKPIAFIPYNELKATIIPHDKKPKKQIKSQQTHTNIRNDDEDILQDVKSLVSLDSILSKYGVDTSINPSNCPFHSSKGGKCLSWNGETIHCFHCNDSWNIFSWVMANENCNFKTALEKLCDYAGISDRLEDSRKKWAKKNNPMKVFTDKKIQMDSFENIQPLFYDKGGLFWLWNKDLFCWEISDEVDILNMITDSTGKDVISSKNRTEILNTLKQFGRRKIPEPIKKSWIQFKDKIYDYENGESFIATPEYFVTNPIPYSVSGDPRTPTMDKIFTEWVGEEYKETLYEILAYCLISDYPIHRLFCLIGEGMNGKSKFLELLRKFIGTTNVCSTELDTLLGSRFEITKLHKKLVCQMGETNFNQMNRTSILKKLTGGDLIGFEYKNKNPFEEINYAKILLATNNLPTTSDKTIGFYRRWLIIDFPNRFSEKKDILGDIPEKEYENLATHTLICLKKLIESRSFTNEGNIEQRMERYEKKSNFLEKFIEEYTEEDFESHITLRDFYNKFKSWCIENKLRTLTDVSVGRSMKKLGFEKEKKYFNWMFDGKGGQIKCWINVKWKD